MQSQFENESLALRSNLITIDRPDSSQLVDLHVYIIPKHVWKDRQNLAENEAMEQAISAGFVRVPQNLNIRELREQIRKVCGQDNRFPKEFIYLRSVGRCLTKVKPQQETDLRVKNYRPPTTFAPEIYLLEAELDDDPLASAHSNSFLYRESHIHRPLIGTPQSNTTRELNWPPSNGQRPPTTTRSFVLPIGEHQDSTFTHEQAAGSFSNLSRASSSLSPRDLAKLREEQERLRLRQLELARQRREIELQQQRQEIELNTEKRQNEQLREEKRQSLVPPTREESRRSREEEELAATRIQATYRGHRTREKIKEQKKQQELAAAEIERLQKEARELARRKAEEEQIEEKEARDVVKLSDTLEELKSKRNELEAAREAIIRQMQQIHSQITVRRKEERDQWKTKYLIEKKKTVALEERARTSSIDRTDVKSQLEQAKLDLKNSFKLRHQAETECQMLKQEINQIRSSMKTFDQQAHSNPALRQQNIPISLDITLQY